MRAAQKQDPHESHLAVVESQPLVEDLPVAHHGSTVRWQDVPDQPFLLEGRQGDFDGGLVERRHRIPVRDLVAGENQGVEAERVLLRGGQLLLDQTAQDPPLHEVESHRSSIRSNTPGALRVFVPDGIGRCGD
ncbi:MAG TPA: hypothetical protein VFH56_04275 [Acidimicrobiales bacterium]|nr:hypothetical protein [Acidimicrobiales bacterium]